MAPGDKRGRRLSDGGMTRLREAEGKAQLLEVGMGGGVFGCVCICGFCCYLLWIVSFVSLYLRPTPSSDHEFEGGAGGGQARGGGGGGAAGRGARGVGAGRQHAVAASGALC